MNKPTQKLKIYQEEAKQRHVTHWDWDYMTTSDIDSMIEPTDIGNRTKGRKESCFGKIFHVLSSRLPSTSSAETSR